LLDQRKWLVTKKTLGFDELFLIDPLQLLRLSQIFLSALLLGLDIHLIMPM
jgi:hypothetical protein